MLGAGTRPGEVELVVPSLGLFFEALQMEELDREISYLLLSRCRRHRRRAAWEGWVEGERRTSRGWHKGVMGGGGQLRRQEIKFCQLLGKTGSRRLRRGERQRASPCELFHLS